MKLKYSLSALIMIPFLTWGMENGADVAPPRSPLRQKLEQKGSHAPGSQLPTSSVLNDSGFCDTPLSINNGSTSPLLSRNPVHPEQDDSLMISFPPVFATDSDDSECDDASVLPNTEKDPLSPVRLLALKCLHAITVLSPFFNDRPWEDTHHVDRCLKAGGGFGFVASVGMIPACLQDSKSLLTRVFNDVRTELLKRRALPEDPALLQTRKAHFRAVLRPHVENLRTCCKAFSDYIRANGPSPLPPSA